MSIKHITLGWLYTAKTAWKFSKSWWKFLLLAMAANILCALFEGCSIGLVAVGLQVLSNPTDLAGGFIGNWGEKLQGLLSRYGQERLFVSLTLLSVFFQVLRSGFQFLAVSLTASVRPRVQALATNEIYSRILRLSFPQTGSFRLGDLTDYLQQPVHLNEAFARFNDLVRAVLFLVVYGAILFWLSWPMTLIALALYAVASRLMGTVVRQVAGHSAEVRQGQLGLTQKAAESFQALRVLHAFNRREESIRNVAVSVEKTRLGQKRALIWSNLSEPLTDAMSVVGVGGFITIGYFLHQPGQPSPLPALLAFLAAMHRVTPSLRALHAHQVALTNLAPNMKRMNDILEQQPVELPPGRPFNGLRQSIDFQETGLQYFTRQTPAVSGLRFSIPRGSFTAIVGLSGSGKSTVADLLLRLYEPTEGAILVDGAPLSGIDRGDWLARIGSVSQDPFLFHASIRENILFGKADATEEQVLSAARAAHADDFIGKLAEGYGTTVGERGQRLSGGEAQRIALARALIREPDLLILDEATSALDSDSERQIQQALEEQRSQRTILAIAHRFSTVARADQILVLSHGRLVEQGTHEELIERNGAYAHLWKLQVEGERPAAVRQAGPERSLKEVSA